MKTTNTIRITKAPTIHGRRGWDWRVERDGRVLGSGWTSGTKAEARADAESQSRFHAEMRHSIGVL